MIGIGIYCILFSRDIILHANSALHDFSTAGAARSTAGQRYPKENSGLGWTGGHGNLTTVFPSLCPSQCSQGEGSLHKKKRRNLQS